MAAANPNADPILLYLIDLAKTSGKLDPLLRASAATPGFALAGTGATVVGFGGVLVMLKPSTGGFGALDIAYVVALGAAFFYALAAIAMRQLGQTEPALRTTIYFSSVAALAGGIGCLFDWVDPTPRQLALVG